MPQKITGLAVSNGLTEAFGLTGKLALSLDEIVVPVVMVGDLGEALWGPPAVCSVNVPAGGALNRAQVEIALPVTASGQGAALIVDAIDVIGTLATGQFFQVGPSPGLPAPTHFGLRSWLDVGKQGAPYAQVTGKNDAPAAAGFVENLIFRMRQYDTQRFKLGWVLREFPGTGIQQGLMIRNQVDNETLRCNIYWRERVPR